MSFFPVIEPMPALPWAPPQNRIPVAVAWHFVLLQTVDTAVAVTNFSASPEGVQFTLVTLIRPLGGGEDGDGDGDGDGFLGDGFRSGLRFGIRLPDGSQVDRNSRARDQQKVPVPPGFHLSGRGGSAGATMAEEDLWLWPLPGPGTISFGCAWPSRGASEAVIETSTDELLHAASLADELWPLPPLVPPRG